MIVLNLLKLKNIKITNEKVRFQKILIRIPFNL